jgi:aminoglycoside phosphotransferase (APT) family kinase protein
LIGPSYQTTRFAAKSKCTLYEEAHSVPQWTADIDIDPALAAKLIASQFPELARSTVQPLGFGWDNAAFLIDNRIVFRFPRRKIAAGLIEREIAVLPHVEKYLPLAISAPQFVGIRTADYPWVFAGYELIVGSTLCSVALSDSSRGDLAEPIAAFLKALHDVEPAQLIGRGLPPDEIGRLDHEKRLRMTRERVLDLTLSGDLVGGDLLTTWLEAYPTVALEDEKRRLVHGDLYARHILISNSGQPTGVIDWGDVHLGDPALDIAIAHLILPSNSHAAFRAAYGPIDDRTWNAARYRAIYHAILELDYGIREGDVGMQESGRTALRLINDATAARLVE